MGNILLSGNGDDRVDFTKSDILKNKLVTKNSLRIKLLGDSITHGLGGTDYSPTEEHIAGKFHRNNKGHCWANSFRDYMKIALKNRGVC